jgi:hypothetical protein
MTYLEREIALFAARRDFQNDAARQNAAFFIMSGIDLPLALKSQGEERKRIILRIERLLERERLKGMRRHWSYDLNRHIALMQALDSLRKRTDARTRCSAGIPRKAESTKTNGARRRR